MSYRVVLLPQSHIAEPKDLLILSIRKIGSFIRITMIKFDAPNWVSSILLFRTKGGFILRPYFFTSKFLFWFEIFNKMTAFKHYLSPPWIKSIFQYFTATIELYEGNTQANSTVWTSFDAPPLPAIEQQAYIIPATIVSMRETITEKGITNKHVLSMFLPIYFWCSNNLNIFLKKKKNFQWDYQPEP